MHLLVARGSSLQAQRSLSSQTPFKRNANPSHAEAFTISPRKAQDQTLGCSVSVFRALLLVWESNRLDDNPSTHTLKALKMRCP